MKISDVLRSLADQVDQQEMQAAQPAADNQPDETDVFVSPLQQKLELLKKSVGVDNIYDNPEEQSAEPHDDLDQLKKLSGLAKVMHQVANDSSDPM